MVYDYDYHYRLKEEQGAVAKDTISQYRELKRIMFYSADDGLDLEKYNLKYKHQIIYFIELIDIIWL